MHSFKRLLAQYFLLLCLVLAPAVSVTAADIPVYKGVLRVSTAHDGHGNTLLLQFRTRTREVLRVTARRVTVRNNRTRRVMRLPDASAKLAPGHNGGYLYADIEYNGVNLAGDDYRVEGSLTVYLARGQQTRNFRVYLSPDIIDRPPDSSIDWGIDNPAR